MKKHGGWIALLILLALLVPWASQQPDALQKLLQLPGGANGFLKAVGGLLLSGTLVYLVMRLLVIARGTRPKQ